MWKMWKSFEMLIYGAFEKIFYMDNYVGNYVGLLWIYVENSVWKKWKTWCGNVEIFV